ncbi:hypothetical protein SAMN02745671_01148 [Anaerovibrio lipolyticus DSM 3074]|uniref:Uncharacterized protein n=1 Tax=Anaerovibrio lipolyticus DSM 3074 TaxID=1120997 RepID=A0A1M6CK09_9FIRM|nr:hypothetical protein [Anaerovibrio lipolyticus]SHI61309.1 hypothetical protein SAMN02745671_01148 [Anaerovibrio lipolyticus DSM 3074]
MALDNGSMSPADMAAVMGNNNGFGNDCFGGWWMMWFLLILMIGGGWNNWGGGFGGNGNGFLPYMGATSDVQRGFDQSAIINAINGVSSQIGNGFADNAVAQCQGNATTVAAITNGQYATANAINGAKDSITGTLYTNQLANTQAMNGIAMGLQNSLASTQAGLADVKYTVATENCADRQALSTGIQSLLAQGNNNTNGIVNAITQGVQSIKDDLCADRIAAKDAQIQNLQSQLNMANLAASQTAQTAQLLTYGSQQAQNIVNTCCPKPVPAYVVSNPSCGCNGGFVG